MANVKNADLLAELTKSRNTFCFFKYPQLTHYDAYIDDALDLVDTTILAPGFIIRKLDYSHVPTITVTDTKTKLPKQKPINTNFPPFSHWLWNGQEWEEVARSHWVGSLSNGEFSMTHGQTTEKLGALYIQMVDNFARKANWRSYTYLDEMKDHTLFELLRNGMKFNEGKALMLGKRPNPFSYLTSIMQNSMQFQLAKEKEQQAVIDDIAFEAGVKELTYNQQAKIDVDRYHGKIHTSYSSLRGEKPKLPPEVKVVTKEEKTMFATLFTLV